MLPVWSSTTGRGRAMLALGLVLLVAGTAWGYLLVAGLGGCLVLLGEPISTSAFSWWRCFGERELAAAVVVVATTASVTVAVRLFESDLLWRDT